MFQLGLAAPKLCLPAGLELPEGLEEQFSSLRVQLEEINHLAGDKLALEDWYSLELTRLQEEISGNLATLFTNWDIVCNQVDRKEMRDHYYMFSDMMDVMEEQLKKYQEFKRIEKRDLMRDGEASLL
jgi:hypothetical protein